MGNVLNRGSRDEPSWYIKFKDVDGVWKRRHSRQETKERARRFLLEVEGRVSRGLVGIPDLDNVPLAGALMDTWSASITNRNAPDDRSRITRHVRPAWADIRVRFSYDGPLKEDKGGQGKVKWVPAADDTAILLGPLLAQRQAEGAGPEGFVFACPGREGSFYRKEFIEQCWEKVSKARKLELTWYQATRHSFTSRNLSGGASLDEVSAGLGHSSPVVTRRYYDHFVRRQFSDGLRGGLGYQPAHEPGGIVTLPRPAPATAPAAPSTSRSKPA